MERNDAGRKQDRVLAIMSVYDANGIIDDYIIYYLMSIKKIADRIIVAVNGDLTADGGSRLRTVVNEIYVRPNRGFDFGAYKEVIYHYLEPHEIFNYQELLLCNDTCFGPFIPLENICMQMDDEKSGFWSMNFIDDVLFPHFQSYFMVFRKEAINLLVNFLHTEVDDAATEIVQAHGYEHALSEMILKSGIKCDYYTSKAPCPHDVDIYGAPDCAIEKLGLPLIKKKVFSGQFCRYENAQNALRIIAETKNYPVKYILEYVKRVYKKEYRTDINVPLPTAAFTFKRNCTGREEVIEFCRKHEVIYVYGNGYMSALFMARFKRYMSVFGGYIVSDEYYTSDSWKGEKVYPLAKVEKDTPIIVALMEESAKQVAEKLCDRKNVLFLSIKMEFGGK